MRIRHYFLPAILASFSLLACATPRQTPAAPDVVLPTSTHAAMATAVPSKIETPVVAQTTPMTSPTPPDKAANPAAVIVTFGWSGGFAGRNDVWTLHADGSVESNKGERRTLSAGQVDSLLAEIERLGFFNLPGPSADPSKPAPGSSGCADCFVYDINVSHDGRSRQMKIVEVDLTQEQQQLVALLRGVLAGA